MEKAARIVSIMLRRLAAECVVGQTGANLDAMTMNMLQEYGATSYNKGYHPEWAKVPFPGALCVSPNGVYAHGIPNNYVFKNGDIVTLDLGILVDGFCGDAALTVPIGVVTKSNNRLINVARRAVYAYISQLRPGIDTRFLAQFIEGWVAQQGFYTNRTSSGHHIGKTMHEKPNLYNSVEDQYHTYAILKDEVTVCIEPIICKGRDRYGSLLSDGWSRVTIDRKNTAMFEHMVRVTQTGPKILTDHFDKNSNYIPYSNPLDKN